MGEGSTNSALERMLSSLIEHEEEFRELDAAAGDGDLGITVRSAAAAIMSGFPKVERLGQQRSCSRESPRFARVQALRPSVRSSPMAWQQRRKHLATSGETRFLP